MYENIKAQAVQKQQMASQGLVNMRGENSIAAPATPDEIGSQLSLQQDLIVRLEDALDLCESRLYTIVRPPDQQGVTGADSPPASTQMGQVIFETNVRLARMVGRLRSLNERIAL